MDFTGQAWAAVTVLGMLGAMLWWLRRRGLAGFQGARSGVRRLESLERMPLGPQHTLHLVRLGDEVLLLACSPSGCGMIRRVEGRQLGVSGEVRP